MIVVVPGARPVTSPVLETVATDVLEEIHGFDDAGTSEPVNWVLKPTQTLSVPVIVGRGLTVMVAVCWQPLLFV